MPSVVRSIGDLKRAKNVDGEEVVRSDFLQYHDGYTKCLNTDNHFIYRSRRVGSALLCTCGGQVVSVGYHTYRKYSRYVGNEVLMCYYFMTDGKHADGST